MPKFFGSGRAQATLWGLPAIVGGACILLASEQLLAQNEKVVSDPCDAIVAGFESKVGCAWAGVITEATDYKFRVDEFQEFDWPSKTKIAFATIFNASAVEKAKLLSYFPLKESIDDPDVLDALSKGKVYPAISAANGKYYVLRVSDVVDKEDWAEMWNILINGFKSGKFTSIGIASESDQFLDKQLFLRDVQGEKILGWGGEYGVLLPVKE